MNKVLSGPTKIVLVLVVSSLFLLACDVASLISQANPSTAKSSAEAQVQPTAATGAKESAPASGGTKSTAAPTRATKAQATETPPAVPTPLVGKVGQRIVNEGYALTVTKAEALDTFGGTKADAGFKWVVATVTVENVTGDRATVVLEQFSYVDRDGGLIDGILNGPSAPGTTGKDVLGYHSLMAGGKVQNKIIPIQMEQELVPGSRLLFKLQNEVMVDLGL